MIDFETQKKAVDGVATYCKKEKNQATLTSGEACKRHSRGVLLRQEIMRKHYSNDKLSIIKLFEDSFKKINF